MSAPSPVRPVDAAGLVLIRDSKRGLEVLVGRRHSRVPFLPDIYVFPGGRVDDSDSLANIQGSIRSNIGRRQRAVVYSAWRRYFLLGLQDPNYPIEWRTALLSD